MSKAARDKNIRIRLKPLKDENLSRLVANLVAENLLDVVRAYKDNNLKTKNR